MASIFSSLSFSFSPLFAFHVTFHLIHSIVNSPPNNHIPLSHSITTTTIRYLSLTHSHSSTKDTAALTMVDAKSVISISPDAKVAIISAMLKHPDDLSTLTALRQKLIREKAIVDQQLKIGVQNQMEETKEALDILGTTKEQVLGVRANMKNIDSLCKDAQGLITDYSRIRKVLITCM